MESISLIDPGQSKEGGFERNGDISSVVRTSDPLLVSKHLDNCGAPNAGRQPFRLPSVESGTRFLSSFETPCISSTIIANR